jgi:hypothetical protein
VVRAYVGEEPRAAGLISDTKPPSNPHACAAKGSVGEPGGPLQGLMDVSGVGSDHRLPPFEPASMSVRIVARTWPGRVGQVATMAAGAESVGRWDACYC